MQSRKKFSRKDFSYPSRQYSEVELGRMDYEQRRPLKGPQNGRNFSRNKKSSTHGCAFTLFGIVCAISFATYATIHFALIDNVSSIVGRENSILEVRDILFVLNRKYDDEVHSNTRFAHRWKPFVENVFGNTLVNYTLKVEPYHTPLNTTFVGVKILNSETLRKTEEVLYDYETKFYDGINWLVNGTLPDDDAAGYIENKGTLLYKVEFLDSDSRMIIEKLFGNVENIQWKHFSREKKSKCEIRFKDVIFRPNFHNASQFMERMHNRLERILGTSVRIIGIRSGSIIVEFETLQGHPLPTSLGNHSLWVDFDGLNITENSTILYKPFDLFQDDLEDAERVLFDRQKSFMDAVKVAFDRLGYEMKRGNFSISNFKDSIIHSNVSVHVKNFFSSLDLENTSAVKEINATTLFRNANVPVYVDLELFMNTIEPLVRTLFPDTRNDAYVHAVINHYLELFVTHGAIRTNSTQNMTLLSEARYSLQRTNYITNPKIVHTLVDYIFQAVRMNMEVSESVQHGEVEEIIYELVSPHQRTQSPTIVNAGNETTSVPTAFHTNAPTFRATNATDEPSEKQIESSTPTAHPTKHLELPDGDGDFDFNV